MYFSAEAFGLVPVLAVALLATRPRGARLIALIAGLALIFAAFATRLQPLAVHTFLWAHLLQNVVLAEWAPALLVLAIPPNAAARAHDFPLFRPLVALPLWIATYFLWHLPWAYDGALHHPHSLLHVEHVSYLLAGMCVWWPVIHGRYSAGARGGVPLRGVRARLATRARARSRPTSRLLGVRARTAHVGTVGTRRPAARRRDDGGGAGDRLLHRLHGLPAPLPAGGAARRRVRRAQSDVT